MQTSETEKIPSDNVSDKKASSNKRITKQQVFEKIVNINSIDGKDFYEVKWVGWPAQFNTLEPLENLLTYTNHDRIKYFEKKLDSYYYRVMRTEKMNSSLVKQM